MSIEAILDLVRQRFSPSSGKIILKSLNQDPLVWQFVQNEEKSLPYFESAQNEIQAFSPGSIALWLIEQEMSVSLPEINDFSQRLPDSVRQRAAKVFQTVLNTGLPPNDLLTAGYLALTLREMHLIKDSWQGISEEIIINQNPTMLLKHFQTWRTPFACLHSFCPNFDQIIADFTASQKNFTVEAAIPLFLHTYLANPFSPEALMDELFNFAKGLSIEGQLKCLQWLDSFEQESLRKSLAINLMQTRETQTYFAEIFSEFEAIETLSDKGDPLDKTIRFSLPERMNRLAAFHYYAGNKEKAVETYQKSCDLINTIKSQTNFQALAIQGTAAPSSAWMRLIQNLPDSQKAHLFHIRSMIEGGSFEEAREQLRNIPDSQEKDLLELMLDSQHKKNVKAIDDTKLLYQINKIEESLPIAEFYVRRPSIDSPQEIIRAITKIDGTKQRISVIGDLLDFKSRDTSFLTFARSEYEDAGYYSQATEIASFLERIEPEKVNHQRALARLYSKSTRWQDAFSLLQKMIRNTSTHEVIDLAAFAESALMTDRIDMAISICQNILKLDKTNAKALIILGKGYMEKGDVVKAIQHMEQVIALIPDDPQTWIHLARFWENSGQTDRAFEILRQGILAIPDDPQLLHEIGKAHLDKASPTEARVNLKKALEAAPSNNEIRLNLAKAEFQLGNLENAYELIEPLSDSYESIHPVAHLLGNLLLAMGESERAKPVLLSAASQNPDDLETVLKTSNLILAPKHAEQQHNKEEQLDKLGKILELASTAHPNNAQLKLQFADLDRISGRNQEAHTRYTQLAMGKPAQKDLPDWRVQYGLGLTSTALGDIDIGLAALKDAALSQPDNLEIIHALAQTYVKADLRKKALECAKSALKPASQDIDNLIWFAQFTAENNYLEETILALQEALQLDPDRLDVKLLYAKTLISMGSLEESIDCLDELIKKDSAQHNQLHQIAYLYIQAQQLDRGLLALEKALNKCEQTDPVLLMDMAVLYTLLDHRKKALELLDLNNSTITKYPTLVILKAKLLSEIGQYSQAIQILDLIEGRFGEELSDSDNIIKNMEQSPLLFRYDFSHKGYLFQRGQLMRATGKLNEAQLLLERAGQAAPEDQKIQNALVGVFTASLNYEKALQNVELSNPLDPKSGDLDLNQIDLSCSQIEILLDQKNEVKARKIFKDLALIKRKYPRLLALKSRLAALDGETSQSSDYLSQAIEDYRDNFREINPTTPSELFRIQANLQSIANAFSVIGDYQSAHYYQQEAWSMRKNQPDINISYVQTLTNNAEKQQIAHAVKLIEHAPGPQVLDDKYYQLGRGLLDGLKNYLPEKDLMCLQARLTSAFSGKWPMQLHTESCLESPEFGAAFILGCEEEDQIEKITSAFPDSLPVLHASSIFTLRTGKGDGKAAVDKALRIDTANPINHALLGLLTIDEPESAAKAFTTALQFWPEEPEWHRILADLYSDLGDADKAAEHITQAIENQPDNGSYWQTRAGIHLQMNHLEQAKMDLEKSTQLQSQDAESWISMADVNRRLGNISEAAENIHTAVELQPHDSNIAIQEIEFLFNQGKYQEAAEKASRKIGKNGNNKKFKILLARSKAKLGEFDLALTTLEDLNVPDNKDADIELESIKIKKDRDGVEASLPELIQLAQKYPEHPETLTTLTDWLIQTNRLSEAQETAQTVLRIIPDSAEVHLMLGRLQRLNGQLDQATAHLSDAIAHDPDLIEAYIELGKTYQDRRDLEEAIKVFQLGSKVNASDPRPYYHAGMALKTCKNYSAAEAMLKQAKKYAPGDANIIRQLGVITALNLINNLRETS